MNIYIHWTMNALIYTLKKFISPKSFLLFPSQFPQTAIISLKNIFFMIRFFSILEPQINEIMWHALFWVCILSLSIMFSRHITERTISKVALFTKCVPKRPCSVSILEELHCKSNSWGRQCFHWLTCPLSPLYYVYPSSTQKISSLNPLIFLLC